MSHYPFERKNVKPPRSGDAHFRRRLTWIVFAGLLCRGGGVILAEKRPALFDFPDTHRYLSVARHMAAGDGPIESKSVRAGTDPFYPALLAFGDLVGLDSDRLLLRWGRVLNTLAGLISIVLLAGIARNIAGPRVGLIAAFILAIDPIMVFFNSLVLTESCYIALLLAAAFMLVRAQATPHAVMLGLAGLLFGLGTLTRSTSLFLPIFFLPIIGRIAPGRRRAASIAIFAAAYIVPLLPTTIRNYTFFGHFVPVRTGSGAALLEALGPWADGSPGMDRIEYPAFPLNANEYERDRLSRAAALRYARQDPARVLRLALSKLRRTWSITLNAAGYSSPLFNAVALFSVAPIFILAVAGIWILRKKGLFVGFLLAPAIYMSLVHAIFVGSIRYRLPAMPFLFILAAVAIDRLWRRIAASPTI